MGCQLKKNEHRKDKKICVKNVGIVKQGVKTLSYGNLN